MENNVVCLKEVSLLISVGCYILFTTSIQKDEKKENSWFIEVVGLRGERTNPARIFPLTPRRLSSSASLECVLCVFPHSRDTIAYRDGLLTSIVPHCGRHMLTDG